MLTTQLFKNLKRQIAQRRNHIDKHGNCLRDRYRMQIVPKWLFSGFVAEQLYSDIGTDGAAKSREQQQFALRDPPHIFQRKVFV